MLDSEWTGGDAAAAVLFLWRVNKKETDLCVWNFISVFQFLKGICYDVVILLSFFAFDMFQLLLEEVLDTLSTLKINQVVEFGNEKLIKLTHHFWWLLCSPVYLLKEFFLTALCPGQHNHRTLQKWMWNIGTCQSGLPVSISVTQSVSISLLLFVK